MHLLKNTRGLSLVETIVVVAIFTMLSLAVTTAVFQFYSSNAYTIAQTSEVHSASRSMKLMVRDIREATYADNGSYPVVSASTSTLSFYSDIDRDDSVELVTYMLSETTLTKEIINATGTPPVYGSTPDEIVTVSEYVRNIEKATSTFLYYDNTGTEIDGSSITDIASVALTVIVNVDPNKNPDLFELSSHTTLRNLKDNL